MSLTPEAQGDGCTGLIEAQTCGFILDNSPWYEPPYATDDPPAPFIESIAIWHAPVVVPDTPAPPGDPSPPFMFAGLFDPSGGGADDSVRTDPLAPPEVDDSRNQHETPGTTGGGAVVAR